VPLRDVLTPKPRVLFVGINPSLRSEAVGHHFASPGNPFWRLLYAAGLVPVELTHTEDRRLAEFGLALTNLCSRATRAAAELGREEIERGKRRLTVKIRRLRPEVVAFVGITIYRDFFRDSFGKAPARASSMTSIQMASVRQTASVGQTVSAGGTASAGAGAKTELICGAKVFVLPNPSGLNASFPGFKHKLVWFERLREFIDSAPRPSSQA
jgi:double-stranded uracil-DNA glycosylase